MENKEVKKKRERNVTDHIGTLTELSDLVKYSNIHFVGVPEDREIKGKKVSNKL